LFDAVTTTTNLPARQPATNLPTRQPAVVVVVSLSFLLLLLRQQCAS
jgi:hypothetical protein